MGQSYHPKKLNRKVVNTFLGDDVINSEEDVKNHFKWCFNDVVEKFSQEGIYFLDTKILKEYFYNFYIEIFYNSSNKKMVQKTQINFQICLLNTTD